MGKLRILIKIFIIAAIFFIKSPGFAHASSKAVKVYKEYHGSFMTTVKGTGESQPPYIKVVRSEEGISYLFNKFRIIRKFKTHSKARRLERELLRNNYSKRMVVAILSHPIDSYNMGEITILENKTGQKMEINVPYYYEKKIYSVPPFKSIFYRFYIIKNSDYPVVFNAIPNQKKKTRAKKINLMTVYGKLEKWAVDGKPLALIKRVKRKKKVFYIKGELQNELMQHIGKFISLRGEVTLDTESIYEADFFVSKIVKVF